MKNLFNRTKSSKYFGPLALIVAVAAFIGGAALFGSIEWAAGLSLASALPVWLKKDADGVNEFLHLEQTKLDELSEDERKAYFRALNKHTQAMIADHEAKIAKFKGTEDELKELKAQLGAFKVEDHRQLLSIVKTIGEDLATQKRENRTSTAKKSPLSVVKGFVEGMNFKEIMDSKGRLKSDAKFQGYKSTTFKAPALMTIGTNVLPNVADGFNPNVGNYIDNDIAGAPKPERFILNYVDVQNQTGADAIYYTDRINEEGDAAFISEGALKPLIDGEYQASKAEIGEVAERWKMSNRMMMHTERVVSDFQEHAEELIRLQIDSAVLGGDGISPNISGIQTLASAFVAPAGLANYYSNTNIYDVIHAAATQVMEANFMPSTIILSTVWMAKMKGIKNTEGDYIVPPFVTPDGKTVSGMNVLFTNNAEIGDDDIIVGDLAKFKVVFAEDVMYAMGYENDDFSKNLTSNKLEAYLGTYLKQNHVAAIVADNISTITTAITTV